MDPTFMGTVRQDSYGRRDVKEKTTRVGEY